MESTVAYPRDRKRYKHKEKHAAASIRESDELKEFSRLLNELPPKDLEDVILYVKIKDKAMKSAGKVLPPSAETWMRLPYWLKLKIFMTALFYEQVFILKKKLWLK